MSVWGQMNMDIKEYTLRRQLTSREHEEVMSSAKGDPCDNCCCGACGSRKKYPGQTRC